MTMTMTPPTIDRSAEVAEARLLLVDDEPQLIRALAPALSAAGYALTTAADATEALALMAAQPFDAIFLDLGLPDLDGKEVIARIRDWSGVPIIVLSARDLEAEKILALDLGANDFINKPFTVGELLARLRAAMRIRNRSADAASRFCIGGLDVDFVARKVRLDGARLHLTPREYALLRTMASHSDRVLTHRQIINAVWGVHSTVDAQSVRVLVGQLRQKIETDPNRPRYLLTETGVGYSMASDDGR